MPRFGPVNVAVDADVELVRRCYVQWVRQEYVLRDQVPLEHLLPLCLLPSPPAAELPKLTRMSYL